MSNFKRKPKNQQKNKTKKIDILLILKKNWQMIFIMLVVICALILWSYLNHLNRQHLFIDLIRESKTDLIIFIFPFTFVCFLSLILLSSSGFNTVIYLNELEFYNYQISFRRSALLIIISALASTLPIIIVLCWSYFFPKEKVIEKLLPLSIFVIVILTTLCFFVILKTVKLENKSNSWKIFFHSISLSCFPFLIFYTTVLLLVSKFVTGSLSWQSIGLVSWLIFFLAIISLTPLICYFYNIHNKKFSDKNDLLVRTIKGSFYTGIITLFTIFIIFQKIFIFASYLTLQLLGITDLSSVYEYGIIKNNVNTLKLQQNKWDVEDDANNLFLVKGTIGFHLGDIYLICKKDFKQTFLESLKYDFSDNTPTFIDDENCIAFNQNEISILHIKKQ